MKFKINGEDITLSDKEALSILILTTPALFKKNGKYSEAQIKSAILKVDKEDLKECILSKRGLDSTSKIEILEESEADTESPAITENKKRLVNPSTGRTKYINPKPVEWERDEKGRIKNISGGNFVSLKREIESRGHLYNFNSIEEGRRYLRKLENEKFAEEKLYESVESGYLTPKRGRHSEK